LRARRDAPLAAEAVARTGDIEGARRIVAATPLDCAACLRARAEVESAARNWPAADAWYARAAAFAPRLPQAETQWGESLLARGDAKGATGKLAAASTKGPRDADPLELWGEALLATGDAKGAATKFMQAGKFAPRWGRLHLKWGEALAARGKVEDARTKWRAAVGMDLAPADRARLDQLLARA
jgi:Flp pilus assembly protein TadD